MTFKEAYDQFQELLGEDEYFSLSYEVTKQPALNSIKTDCSLYSQTMHDIIHAPTFEQLIEKVNQKLYPHEVVIEDFEEFESN